MRGRDPTASSPGRLSETSCQTHEVEASRAIGPDHENRIKGRNEEPHESQEALGGGPARLSEGEKAMLVNVLADLLMADLARSGRNGAS